MPTWLVHGFRWPRVAIRIHIIIENLEDCASEYLMAPETTTQLTANFQKEFPKQLAHLPSLRFIEQYDPDDEYTKEQPYAYVCDQVHEVKLGVDVDEIRGAGVQNDAWTALAELRDKVAPGEKVGWFVVVNGDVERWAPPISDSEENEDTETEVSAEDIGVGQSPISPTSQQSSQGKSEEDGEAGPNKKGLKKWFGKIKPKSSKELKTEVPIRNAPTASTMSDNLKAPTSPTTTQAVTA